MKTVKESLRVIKEVSRRVEAKAKKETLVKPPPLRSCWKTCDEVRAAVCGRCLGS